MDLICIEWCVYWILISRVVGLIFGKTIENCHFRIFGELGQSR